MLAAYGIRMPKTEEKLSPSDGYNLLTGFNDYFSVFPFCFSAQS